LYKTYYESDSIAKILSRPEISYKDLPQRNEELTDEVVQQVEITVKYAGYIARQELEVKKFKTLEDKGIPETFDFSTVPSLRLEARQKLGKIRPATIGQAARISGVSPADISILMVYLKRWGANGSKDLELNAEDCNACETDIEE
jgi:tRNA uridine 5-carboxymethylaminomethyl modification enzyme